MKMKIFESVDEVVKVLDENAGSKIDLELPISDQLQDPIGMNMAMIMDKLLDLEFMPNGFEQKNGYRIYRYKYSG